MERKEKTLLLQSYMSMAFFSFSFFFVLSAFLLKLLRSSSWCSCHVCRAYVSSSWTAEFDNICDWYTHLLRRSPTRTIHVHVLRSVVTANPDNVEYMLKTRFNNFVKGKLFSSILGDLLGVGIFNVDGELWRFQRKMACLELGSNSVRSFAAGIVAREVRDSLLPLLASAASASEVVDLQDVFRRFAFESICKISFGLDPESFELSRPMSEFATAFDVASRLSAKRATKTRAWAWKLQRLLNWGSEKKLCAAIREVNSLADVVIRQRRKLGFASSHDLLSRFMGSVSDDKFLRDIVVCFLLAGRDTVASALVGFFLLLSKNPRSQTEVFDEITQVMGGVDDQVANYDQLRGMHYLHAALYESMRIYPPVQFDSKYCLDDDVLPDGTFVRKGTRVTCHQYAMGRMEELWGSDCEEFRPERWLKDGVFMSVSPQKYPVFNAGLRTCVGKEMAIMEMKTVIVAILREFDVDVLETSRPPKFVPGLTATFGGGLAAQVRRRRAAESLC